MMSVQATWDGGVSWQVTSIDAAFDGYGAMAEVSPDLVVFVYGGMICCPTKSGRCPDQGAPQCERRLRSQFIRVEHNPPRLSPVTTAEVDAAAVRAAAAAAAALTLPRGP